MKPKVIIPADGASIKDHLGNERMLTRLGGEVLLVRTIQQFGEWADVCVISSDPMIRKAIKGQKNMYSVDSTPTQFGGVDMIRKGLDQAYRRRSIIVFGDVYFTDEAVAIVRDNVADGWAMYGRSTDNKLTGTRWGEPFAIEVGWGTKKQARDAMYKVYHAFVRGETRRASPWEWYYEMEGMPWDIGQIDKVNTGPHWVEINDLTDDIDYQDDVLGLERAIASQEA